MYDLITKSIVGGKSFEISYCDKMWKYTHPSYTGHFPTMLKVIRDKAAQIHIDVNQHYDDNQYYLHLDLVANTYLALLDEDELNIEDMAILFGCYFHDTIEDARLTYNDVMKIATKLFKDFGYNCEELTAAATNIVYALTTEKGRSRDERESNIYWDGITHTPGATLVKLCDRFANMNYSVITNSGMFPKYAAEWGNIKTYISNKMKNNGISYFSTITLFEQRIINELMNGITNMVSTKALINKLVINVNTLNGISIV